MSIRTGVELILCVAFLVAGFGLNSRLAHTNDEPRLLPVGEPIIIQEYEGPGDGGPNGVFLHAVSDLSIWWSLQFNNPSPERTTFVYYRLDTDVEIEFPLDYRIRQLVVTADDANLFYTSWDAPGCSQELDCLFHFDLLEETTRLVWQSEPMWNPDIDECWLVWVELHPHRARLMNWQKDDTPTALDPGFGDDPRISYPWAAWKGKENDELCVKARNLETAETLTISVAPETMGDYLDIDDSLLVYPVGEYLLTHLFVLDLNDPEGTPRQISWDNGAEKPRIHNKLVVWDYYDGATGRSAIQGKDLETGLTFDIGVRGGMHSYDVRNHIVAWADRTYYPKAQVFIMLTRPYPQRGDMNGDNVVDITDIMLIAQHWRAVEGDPDYDKGWDVNWDGRVDVVDIMLVAVHWGECLNPSTARC